MLLATTALMWALDEQIIGLLTAGFSPDKRALTIDLFQLLLPVILLQGLVKFYGTLINAQHRFGLVAAVPMATPLLTVLLLLAIGRADPAAGRRRRRRRRIELVLLLPLARRLDLLILPRWHGLEPRPARSWASTSRSCSAP